MGVLLIGGAWFFAFVTSDRRHTPLVCEKLVLAHGNVSGNCDGRAGSTCEYVACDFGYALAPTTQGSVDTEVSAEAARPPGGCLIRDVLRPFPPCTSCFGDGLMCELRNRTYPMLSPPPPPRDHGISRDQTVWPEYPYACPSSTEALENCEPEGKLCFGPYNGYPPCEYCNAARDGSGLACEASSRYVRWGLRDDDEDHFLCLSSMAPEEVRRMPLNTKGTQWCKCTYSQSVGSFSPPSPNGCLVTADVNDVVRTGKFCIPIDGLPDIQHLENATRPEANATVCSSSPSTTPSITTSAKRYCGSKAMTGSHLATYDGTDMHCARLYCPAERLGALRIGACRSCEGKEALISFPR